MAGFNLPFQPIRATLYNPSELLAGYDLGRPESFAETTDFLIYRDFIAKGGASSGDYLVNMLQSLHDNSMTQGLRLLLSDKKCVATMGGHDMSRNEPAYKQIADLSRILSQAGYLMASGGGPGAMEATHVGALFSTRPKEEHTAAIRSLGKAPTLPAGLSAIVDKNGQPNMDLVRTANSWFRVAVEIASSVKNPGASLGVPTWKYGHEPFTPFASTISKYFQNSIREDGLTSFASYGIIFAPGKAGTIQEIFQNATNNYYLSFGTFTPMIFLVKKYWTSTYPVMSVLGKLFTVDQMKKHVLVTDSIEEAARFITGSSPKQIRYAHPSFALQAQVRASDGD
jgi:predicted Rossmann-fold nucleotide-binding protein